MVPGEEGFTLLEILVALAILATAITIVFQLFSASLRNISFSEDYVTAAARAESKMREVLSAEDLTEGFWSETSAEGYQFSITVTRALEQKTDALPVQVLDVDLSVKWQKNSKERTIRLKTLKMTTKKV
jgi:type II secretion system protein I